MDDGCMTLTTQGTIGRAVAPTPAASTEDGDEALGHSVKPETHRHAVVPPARPPPVTVGDGPQGFINISNLNYGSLRKPWHP